MPGTYAPPAVEVPNTRQIGRDALAPTARDLAEAAAAGHEDLRLERQVGAAGFGEVDDRQPVLRADLHARPLFARCTG